MTEVNECYESRPFVNSYLAKVYDDNRGGCSILSYRKNAYESTCSRKSICTVCTNGGESGSNKEKTI